MPIALAPFDPSRQFLARTSFRAGGKIWLKNKPFDKSYVNLRVLEQLYEQRRIGYDETRSPEGVVARFDPSVMLGHARRFTDAVLRHFRGPGDLSPAEKHEEQIAQEQDTEEAPDNTASADHGEGASGQPETRSTEDTQGASGTAREAPGASELTEASSATGSAPTTTAEAEADRPPQAEAAAAPEGDAATVAASRQQKIDQLVIDHSQSQLYEMAKDLPGVTVTAKTAKPTLAAAIVDAGDGAA